MLSPWRFEYIVQAFRLISIVRTIATIMQKTGKSRAAAVAVLAATSPAGRLIRPEVVSAAALELCGPGSDGINGRAIEINGET